MAFPGHDHAISMWEVERRRWFSANNQTWPGGGVPASAEKSTRMFRLLMCREEDYKSPNDCRAILCFWYGLPFFVDMTITVKVSVNEIPDLRWRRFHHIR
jgi:hypothetical protein